MRCTPLRALLACAAVLTAAGLAAVAEDTKDDGFTPVFNGKDFTGWKFFVKGDADPLKTWSVKDGVIVCTGNPNGYFYTAKGYKNYAVRYDWRYVKPAAGQKSTLNSGLLVHIQNPGTPAQGGVWPKCVEVQGANKNHGTLYFLQCKKLESKYDQAAKDKATHPVGAWNTTEAVLAADGSITAQINGAPVASGKSDLTEGPFGFQSEGAEVHFRNIKVKQLR